jgi:hypothetical protein
VPFTDTCPLQRSSTVSEPEDVQRYLRAINAFSSGGEKDWLFPDTTFCAFGLQKLEDFFVLVREDK